MKDIKKLANSHMVVILLFIVSLFSFYLLNHWTNISTDDFAYKFNISYSHTGTYCRIKNPTDIAESMATHYMLINGRILANGFAQLFLISENKAWFNLANTIVFGLFQIIIILVSGAKLKDVSIMFYLLVIILLWFLIPGPNHTFLWLDGSFNYLWVAVLVLAFIYLHKRIVSNHKKVSWYWYPLLFFSGFIAGAGHEVLSVGLTGAYCLYYLFNRRKITGVVIAMVSGLCIGTAFVVFAPGNMVRMESEGLREATFLLMIAQRLWAFLLSARSMIALITLILVLVFLRLRYKESFLVVLERNKILLGSIIISLFFIIFSGAFQERVFFGVALFSIIVLLSIVRMHEKYFNYKPVKIVISLLTIILIIEFISVAGVLRENKTNFDYDEATWLSSEDNIFEFREKKINRFVSLGLGEHDRYFWQNIVMSKYYGKEYMIFLPAELYHGLYRSKEIINDQNLIMNCCSETDSIDYAFYQSAGSSFFVMQMEDSFAYEFGQGAFVRFIPFNPIRLVDLDIRQKITKLFYSRDPKPINEEKVLCFSLRTNHGNYLYFKAPEIIPIQSIKTVQIYKNQDQQDFDLQLDMCGWHE